MATFNLSQIGSQYKALTGKKKHYPYTALMSSRADNAQATRQQEITANLAQADLDLQKQGLAQTVAQFDKQLAQTTDQFNKQQAQTTDQFNKQQAQTTDQFNKQQALTQDVNATAADQADTASNISTAGLGLQALYLGDKAGLYDLSRVANYAKGKLGFETAPVPNVVAPSSSPVPADGQLGGYAGTDVPRAFQAPTVNDISKDVVTQYQPTVGDGLSDLIPVSGTQGVLEAGSNAAGLGVVDTSAAAAAGTSAGTKAAEGVTTGTGMSSSLANAAAVAGGSLAGSTIGGLTGDKGIEAAGGAFGGALTAGIVGGAATGPGALLALLPLGIQAFTGGGNFGNNSSVVPGSAQEEWQSSPAGVQNIGTPYDRSTWLTGDALAKAVAERDARIAEGAEKTRQIQVGYTGDVNYGLTPESPLWNPNATNSLTLSQLAGGRSNDMPSNTWLCTEIIRNIGLSSEDNAALSMLRRYSIKNHKKWIKTYWKQGKPLVAAINAKEEPVSFYGRLKQDMVAPVIALVKRDRLEEAFDKYMRDTVSLVKKYAPELLEV